MSRPPKANSPLLTPGEVAALFRVDPKTVTRWAAAGKISAIRTPGGHRRFKETEVRALLEGDGTPEADDALREECRANGPHDEGLHIEGCPDGDLDQ